MMILALNWQGAPANGGSVATGSLFSTLMVILLNTTYLFHMSELG